MQPKKILFCSDFSENCEPARELAVDYARAFGAQLLIIHVVNATGLPGYVDWVGDELDQILQRTQESANARLETLAKTCAQKVGDVKTFCRIGLPAGEIVAVADDESADLIVVGTHGRTGVKHLVMGSIARSVLKTAHRPVLIVEAPAGKGESSEASYEFPVP
jgi:nucleotide-binding universal stress UspA family protein